MQTAGSFSMCRRPAGLDGGEFPIELVELVLAHKLEANQAGASLGNRAK